MHYHPLIGITIFLLAIIISFLVGRKFIKKNIYKKISKDNLSFLNNREGPVIPPKGEITSPDAPWLNKKDNKRQ